MGKPKSIKTKTEYEKALSEIERLWGAACGTPNGDRLDMLATLIDAYENEHFPMTKEALHSSVVEK